MSTLTATVDSPTWSLVVLGKKKVLGCACCMFVDHVELSLVVLTCMFSMMLAWLLVICRRFRTPPRTPRLVAKRRP